MAQFILRIVLRKPEMASPMRVRRPTVTLAVLAAVNLHDQPDALSTAAECEG
jgi:hypothetical protein